MDEQRVRKIVREELAKAVPVIQDRVRSCLALDLARPNKLRRQRGDLGAAEKAAQEARELVLKEGIA